jgi:hypothetical protein
MNDFARNHSGDDVFKRIMFSTAIAGAIFAVYMMLY